MEEPYALKIRPHWKGLPIPMAVVVTNGKPDFATVNFTLVFDLAYKKKCALCGTRMRGNRYAFIGGPVAKANGLYQDGPMHEECARYAAEVCPFVDGRKDEYRDGASRPDEMYVTVYDSYEDTVITHGLPPRTERAFKAGNEVEV
jgi:hypothetical protein